MFGHKYFGARYFGARYFGPEVNASPVGVAAGVGTATGVGRALFNGVGDASGTGTATGVGKWYIRENSLAVSEEFSDAIWIVDGGAFTDDATTAPDGTTTADLYVEDLVNEGHWAYTFIPTVDGETYTWSVYVKPNGRDKFSLYWQDDDGTFNWGQYDFDLDAGVVASTYCTQNEL
jgi:hypothetical protein